MSQENVEILHEFVEAWNRRDMDAMLSRLHPALEWRTSGSFPDLDRVYQGHAGFERFHRESMGAWESFQIVTGEVRDCGEQLISRSTFEGTARNGLVVRRPTASAWTFRDGLGVRVQLYAAWSQALEAVGLRE